jgi:two-component system chemotaxis response regulator CheB
VGTLAYIGTTSYTEPVAHLGYSRFDLVVMASSLGGLDALRTILGALPAGFPASIAIVQHQAARSSDLVVRMLREISAMPVEWGKTGVPLTPGAVFLAPPDRHMLVKTGGLLELTRSGPVKFCRPAADPLFTTAASSFRERTLGVGLTGCNTDGAVGVQAIKWSGGMVLAQAPASARAAGMPRAAIATGCVDLVLPLDAIAPAIIATVMSPGAAEYLRVPLRVA